MSDLDQLLMEQQDVGVDPFDELDEMEMDESVEESEEVEEPGQESDEQQEEDEGQESESEEEDSQEEEGESEDSESEDEQEETDGSEESEGESEDTSVELAKAIEDGSLEIDINGEKATLKDLKNDYIGQKEISRRFSELDVEKKQNEADKEEISGYIRQFATHLRDGDSVGAMQYFGEFAGVPPYMVKEQLIAALRPEIMRREQMNPTEIQNEYLNSQNEYLTQQRQSDNERREFEASQMELQNSINSIREANEISEDEWQSAKSFLETQEDGNNVSPELVKDTILYGRMYEQAESIVKASGEQLENEDKWVEELVNVKEKYPDFTDDDLKEVLSQAIESSRKTNVEQKLGKKLENKKVSSKVKQTKKPEVKDEIDPELEDWL
jgi:hypothetical protein